MSFWHLLAVSTILFSNGYCIELTGLYGRISSPGFPKPYPNDQNITWDIRVPEGHLIKIYFNHFNLESSYLCDYDYVEIKSQGKVVSRFCGTESTDTEKAPGDSSFYSLDNKMTVTFVSDFSREFRGFDAFFAAEDIDECEQPDEDTEVCDHFCHNHIGGHYCSCRPGFKLHTDKKTCITQNRCGEGGYWEEITSGNTALPTCTPDCGKRKKMAKSRIIGGQTAKLGQFPWQVFIETENSFGGGALLLDKWVITAAHVVNPASIVALKMGFINKTDTRFYKASPKSVFVHPAYHRRTYNNDIALIKLQEKVPIGENIRPICLPSKEERFQISNVNTGEVSGWGRTEAVYEPDDLHYVEVNVVDRDTCNTAYQRLYETPTENIITDNMFCAGKRGKDSCQGDSGGALVFEDPDTNKWFIGGIVSWGDKCGAKNQYGVYTKVGNYLDWIHKTMTTNTD